MTTPLKFHWFLPTNGGDGRHVVGGGHGVMPVRPAGRPRCPTSARSPAAPSSSASRRRSPRPAPGARTPGCPRRCSAGLGAAEVPGRVPSRPDLAVPRRADGRHLPEPLRRPAAAQRRHRRREPRAADVRRLPRQGRPLRALRRVPDDRPPPVARRDRQLRGRAPARRGRRAPARSPTRCPRSTSAARRRRPARSRPSTPTST